MAGLGYKDFTAGAVLTAAQVDGYLMEQSVMNFAGTAARGSALASVLSAGQVAHVGGGTLTVYDGSNWQQFAPIGAANRNILFNGAMQVSQRGTSTASITGAGYYTADRWTTQMSSLGTWTMSIENDAPTGSGLRKSMKMLCTTADASPAAGDYVFVVQYLEGQDLQRIAKGTSAAQQLTMSFWVKSNVTGTYIVELIDNDNTRLVSASYTISASATWERKTVTFPADTTGAFDNDNALSFGAEFWLGAGSNFTSGSPLQTTWGTATNTRATGQTNLAAATNNYWQITGVQLETGSQATAFEFKSYGQELQECQRYYYLHASGADEYVGPGYNYAATTVECCVSFPVVMRTDPTLTAASGTDYYYFRRNSADDLFNSLTLGPSPSEVGAMIRNSSEISGTAGQAGFVGTNNAAASIAFSAEL